MKMNLDLFDNEITFPVSSPLNDGYLETIAKQGFRITEVDIGDITFLGGQQESIHRWFRLTPSYSPNLVRFFLKYFKVTDGDLVLDPFSGRGTTVIECKKKSIDCIAIELNPLFQLIGKHSLDWMIDNVSVFDDYLDELNGTVKKSSNKSLEEVIEVYGTRIPDIHDAFRWWQRDVLRDLIIARELATKEQYKSIKNYLWIALNMASLECANIHRNHPTISFDDDHGREISVYDDMYKRVKEIQCDLNELNSSNSRFTSHNDVFLGNSVAIDVALRDAEFSKKPSIVITSPPYPNRFSYIHQTRPQLHFMEILKDRKEATELDLLAIGGTWGRATSILMKNLIEPEPELKNALTYFEELSKSSTLMCNYATKYFIDMNTHLLQLRKLVKSGFKGAYVVGNSRLSGVEIHTECILGNILKLNGFKVTEILVFRKRGGRKKLYETAVCFTD